MANITIDTSWTGHAEQPSLDRLLRRLRIWKRLQRIARYRRRIARLVPAEALDARRLADIGITAPRNRLYDCIERLARAQAGSR